MIVRIPAGGDLFHPHKPLGSKDFVFNMLLHG